MRRMITNNGERLVSDDTNRLQSFRVRDTAEMLRRQLCTRTSGFLQFLETGSFADTRAADDAAIATPLAADVLEGLVVLPQNGTLSLLVSPGVIGVDDPDGKAGSSEPSPPNADDSRYKLVVDPGVQSPGVLAMTAGAVATRVDLIECRRKKVVQEQQSRDIYDVVSGLFTPALVDKVTDEQLEYRVRLGTPGAGIPALQQGWLPICVAVVPTSATNNDSIDFYDVRPLVKDRINAPFESAHVVSTPEGNRWLYANDHTDPAKCTITGVVESSIGMYRCGGLFPFGPTLFDARDVANRAAGSIAVAGFPYFIYAVFPAGLPRWVKYLPAPAVRTPAGPLGIITVSDTGPTDDFGVLPACNPPAAGGLVQAGPCALLAAGVVGSGPAEAGFVMQGGEIHFDPNIALSAPAPTSTSTTDTYHLSPNVHFPSSAKAVFVRIAASFSGGTPGALELFTQTTNVVGAAGDRLAQAHDAEVPFTFSGTGAATLIFTCWVPRPAFPSANGEPDDLLHINVLWGGVTLTRALKSLTVLGWKL